MSERSASAPSVMFVGWEDEKEKKRRSQCVCVLVMRQRDWKGFMSVNWIVCTSSSILHTHTHTLTGPLKHSARQVLGRRELVLLWQTEGGGGGAALPPPDLHLHEFLSIRLRSIVELFLASCYLLRVTGRGGSHHNLCRHIKRRLPLLNLLQREELLWRKDVSVMFQCFFFYFIFFCECGRKYTHLFAPPPVHTNTVPEWTGDTWMHLVWFNCSCNSIHVCSSSDWQFVLPVTMATRQHEGHVMRSKALEGEVNFEFGKVQNQVNTGSTVSLFCDVTAC